VKVLDDAQVKSTSASTYYGGQPTLRVREGTTSTDTFYRTYIKFQVSGLSGTVSDVKQRLRVDGNSGSESKDSGDVYLLSDTSWSESTLKWTNAPAVTGSPVGTAVPAPLGATIDIDLGKAITSDGTYTLALRSHSAGRPADADLLPGVIRPARGSLSPRAGRRGVLVPEGGGAGTRFRPGAGSRTLVRQLRR
jgi:hypothetical protein